MAMGKTLVVKRKQQALMLRAGLSCEWTLYWKLDCVRGGGQD